MKNIVLFVLSLMMCHEIYAQENGIYYIKLDNGMVLDADAGQVNTNSGKIQIWRRVGGNNQKWRLRKNGDGSYQVICVASGKALDLDAGQVNMNGGKIQLWDIVPEGGSQKWVFNPIGNGRYTIRSFASSTNKVLDVKDYRVNDNGTLVQSWSYISGNTANQTWYLEKVGPPISDGLYYIRNLSDKVLEVDAAQANTNGGKIQVWENAFKRNQIWRISRNSNETYTIQNYASGKYLDADHWTLSNDGGKVQVWDRVSGNANQDFIFTPRNFESNSVFSIQCVPCGPRELDARRNEDGSVVALKNNLPSSQYYWFFQPANPDPRYEKCQCQGMRATIHLDKIEGTDYHTLEVTFFRQSPFFYATLLLEPECTITVNRIGVYSNGAYVLLNERPSSYLLETGYHRPDKSAAGFTFRIPDSQLRYDGPRVRFTGILGFTMGNLNCYLDARGVTVIHKDNGPD